MKRLNLLLGMVSISTMYGMQYLTEADKAPRIISFASLEEKNSHDGSLPEHLHMSSLAKQLVAQEIKKKGVAAIRQQMSPEKPTYEKVASSTNQQASTMLSSYIYVPCLILESTINALSKDPLTQEILKRRDKNVKNMNKDTSRYGGRFCCFDDECNYLDTDTRYDDGYQDCIKLVSIIYDRPALEQLLNTAEINN